MDAFLAEADPATVFLPLAGGTMSGTLNVPTIGNILNTDLVIDAYNDTGAGTHNYFTFNPYGGGLEMPTDTSGLHFDNGSRLRKGITDAGEGGAKGVALVCSLDYEFKWEAGRLYVMGQDGFTIRVEQYGFSTAPTATDDDTKGYIVGSRRILDDGTAYTCMDATEDAAVWRREFTANASASMWQYRAETGIITGDPNDGKIIWDNADQVSATSINVSHKDQGGSDIEFFLGFLQEGQQIFLQDRDASQNFQLWSISGTPTLTDGGTATAYFTFPVTLVDSGGTGTTGFADNHQLLFGVTQIATESVELLEPTTAYELPNPAAGTFRGQRIKYHIQPDGGAIDLTINAAIAIPSDSGITFPKTLADGNTYIVALEWIGSKWMLTTVIGGGI